MAAERRSVNVKWFSIREGRFTQEGTKDDHDIVVAGKNGEPDKYYYAFDSISGLLTDIAFRFPDDVKMGEEAIFTLLDEGVKHKFSAQLSGRVGKAMLARLPNILIGSFVKVSAFLGKPKNAADKPYNMVSILLGDQFGNNYEKFPAYYSKETPNGLPQMVSGTVGNKVVWDDSEQVAFLKNMVVSWYIPELQKAGYGKESGQINQRATPAPQDNNPPPAQRPTQTNTFAGQPQMAPPPQAPQMTQPPQAAPRPQMIPPPQATGVPVPAGTFATGSDDLPF